MKKKKEPPALLKLDLACGQSKREGFTGVDRLPLDGVDQVVDLETYPWPWADGSVGEVHCSHYVEHVTDLIAFMDQLYRVMVPGGTALVIAPYYTSARAWQDPTHKRAICEWTWLYFNKGWRAAQKLDHYPIVADFDFSYGYAVNPAWAQKHQEARDFAIRHYWNVVDDIHVTLTRR